MAFLDELRKQGNPLGTGAPGGVYTPQFGPAPVGPGDDSDLMPMFHQIRNRNIQDQERLMRSASDIKLREDFMRARMTPEAAGQPQNVVYQPSPAEQLNPLDLAKFGLEKQKLAQSTKLGEERLGLGEREHQLDELKNRQIYETKINDMQRRSQEAEADLKLKQQQFEANTTNASARMALQQAQMAATDARHQLDIAQRDRQLDESKRQADQRNETLKKQLEDQGVSIEEIKRSDGTSEFKVVQKGAAGASSQKNVYDKSGKLVGTVDAKDAGQIPSGYTVK